MRLRSFAMINPFLSFLSGANPQGKRNDWQWQTSQGHFYLRRLRGLRLSESHASCTSLSLASPRLPPFGSQSLRRPSAFSLVPRSHGWRGWQKQAGAPSASWRPSASGSSLPLPGATAWAASPPAPSTWPRWPRHGPSWRPCRRLCFVKQA